MTKYLNGRHSRFISIMAAVLFVLFPASADASRETPLDSLILNDGGSLTLQMENSEPSRIYISNGEAQRVPRKERIPFDTGKNIIELDIATRLFALKAGAKQITLSGPAFARIAGIEASAWGTDESPAVFIDRDCNLVLTGKADTSAVIRVNSLAKATIDARKFITPEIIIIGPQNNADIAAMPGTSVSFRMDNTPKRTVTMRSWYGGASSTPHSPPSPPGLQQTPQGITPPPPPAAPEAQSPQADGPPPPAAIPGMTQPGGQQ